MCEQVEANGLESDSNGGVFGAVGDRLTVRGRDLDELGGCALQPSGEGRMVACDTGRVCLPPTGGPGPRSILSPGDVLHSPEDPS